MIPCRWSSLLVGSFLATAVAGFAGAEEPTIASTIDAAAATDRVAEAEADRTLSTGSIAPLIAPATTVLVPLANAPTTGLGELPRAAEPAKPAVRAVAQPAATEPVVPVTAETTPPTVPPAAPVAPSAVAAPVPTPAAVEPPAAATAATPVIDPPVSAPVAAEPTAPALPMPALRSDAVTPAAPTEAAAPEAAAAPTETAAAPAAAPVADAAAPVTDAVAPVAETAGPVAEPAPAAASNETVVPPAVAGDTVAAPAAAEATVAAPIPAATPPATAEPAATAALSSAPAEPATISDGSAELRSTGAFAALIPGAPAPAAPAPAVPTIELASAPASAVAEPPAAPSLDETLRPLTIAALEALFAAPPPAGLTVEDRADRTALAAFYAERGHRPLFVDGSGVERARALAAAVAGADRDGLTPADYPLPGLDAAVTPDARARAEVAFAVTAIRYARHLRSGRFDPARLSELVTVTPSRLDARGFLSALATSNPDAAAGLLAAQAPPHEGYRRLRDELAVLRAERATTPPMVRLPEGSVLKPGQKDARVAMLRERLGVGGVSSDADLFDPSLAEAVKAFQRDRGLKPTGAVGPATVVALNGDPREDLDRISDVVVNMERWRWLPRDLGELNVFVNVPDFHLDVMKNGRSIHHARVITGRPENQTPIFSQTMQYIVVNPYWNVPISIIKKEMLAKAQATAGGSLTRGNYEVEVGNRTVDPTTVDWSQVQPGSVSIRQRPGDGNALGNIKFMFPNQHSVYIHDTSSRGLFTQTYRALSHGCVRVHEPFSFADAVLSEEPGGLGGAQLKKMLGGGEKTVNLKRFVPVHVTYFTRFVDADGQFQSRRDVYGHDAKMRRILGL